MTFVVKRLDDTGLAEMRDANSLFSVAFEDPENYAKRVPSDQYLVTFLSDPAHYALVAIEDEAVIGALVAYRLRKFERECSEVYIYDLAVTGERRRRGVATALIEELRLLARTDGADVIFVQADYGDDPAIALYEKLGTREDVMHFDIATRTCGAPS